MVMNAVDPIVRTEYPLSIVRTEYPLSPCNHEEFDTRIMLHAANAASQGYKHKLILANDTDVLGISRAHTTALCQMMERPLTSRSSRGSCFTVL